MTCVGRTHVGVKGFVAPSARSADEASLAILNEPAARMVDGSSIAKGSHVDPTMDAEEIERIRGLFPEAASPYGRIGEF